jgi:hypothetical protein
MPKLTLANGLWMDITPKILPKLIMVKETLIACYRCHTILVKLKYTNKGSTTGQHALKGNVVSFAQDLECAVKLLKTLPSSLESLFVTIVVNFVESSHPLVKLVKSYKLLYVCKFVVTIWLTWLKMNHIGYKNITMNMDNLNILLENDISKPIMRSMFQSTNIELANVEQCTNITDLHQQKRYNEIEHVIETSGLLDFNGININEHEQMINAFQNLHHNQYLSYNHCTTMINEYNNSDLIACMFPTLFPFGIGVLEMNNKPIKLSLQTHVKHLMNLDETHY